MANFDHFVSAAVGVLAQLETAKKPVDAPFRYLASPITSVKPDAVHTAFDLSIMPAELAAEGDGDTDNIAAVSTLIYETNFAIIPDKGKTPSFTVNALRNGRSLGSFHVTVTIDSGGKVTFAVRRLKPTDVHREAFKTVAAQITSGHHVNIRYDSGHSISGGHVFTLRVRRVPFNGYDGRDFGRFDISKEKPSTLNRIGREDSLFCWVQQHTRGWLACDDGSMEKADFIHIDDHATPKVLSLIHVKGANSTAPGRGISVAAYEVVTAQAVKNLLWLDRRDLIAGLTKSVRASNHFWHDGRTTTRDNFIAAVKTLTANYETRVVVLQPHVSLAALARITSDGGAERLRADQLNAILASADRTCGSLGTTFNVICSA